VERGVSYEWDDAGERDHTYPDPHRDDEPNISARRVEPRPNVPLAYAIVAVLIVIAVLVIVL
jgi:hypothetical protein